MPRLPQNALLFSADSPPTPILQLISLALQIACAVHVVRTGREQYWLWIIIIGS
ncbi:MAG: hypothetical protein ABI846_02270 [Rudaea sp.]